MKTYPVLIMFHLLLEQMHRKHLLHHVTQIHVILELIIRVQVHIIFNLNLLMMPARSACTHELMLVKQIIVLQAPVLICLTLMLLRNVHHQHQCTFVLKTKISQLHQVHLIMLFHVILEVNHQPLVDERRIEIFQSHPVLLIIHQQTTNHDHHNLL